MKCTTILDGLLVRVLFRSLRETIGFLAVVMSRVSVGFGFFGFALIVMMSRFTMMMRGGFVFRSCGAVLRTGGAFGSCRHLRNSFNGSSAFVTLRGELPVRNSSRTTRRLSPHLSGVRDSPTQTKKADVIKRLRGIHRIGLLANELSEKNGQLFI